MTAPLEQKAPTQAKTDGEQLKNRKDFIRQFPKNLASHIALFMVNVAAGIWLVPYFIHNLGIAAYGLIPLAMSLTYYVALVTIAISGGIARFLTIDLQQKDLERANRTFNTCFWSLAVILAVSIPLLAAFTQFIPLFFKVPENQIGPSKWLFAGVIGAFLLTTLSSCFSASTFAYNRLDLRNFANTVGSVSRIVFVVLLFSLSKPNLQNVALATLLAALSGFAMHYYFWRKLTPDLSISPSYFDKTRLKDLTTMGGWLVVNHVGYLLFLQIDLIVVNRLFGPTAGGEYASILQWSMLLRSMAGVLSGVLQPMFMICYAREQIEDLKRISKMAVKFMGLGLAVPIGLACGFSSELLTVWIGPEFSRLSPLMVLMLVHLTVNLSVMPLFSINVCYNRVKLPGIVTLLMGGLNLALAILIPVVFDIGFFGVALAGSIVLTLKNAIFTPWYATHIMGLRSTLFLKEMATGIIATFAIFGVGTVLSRMYQINSWTQLIIIGIVISTAYGFFVWTFIMSPPERRIFINMIARRGYGTA